jgi:molecular chaperone GrpE
MSEAEEKELDCKQRPDVEMNAEAAPADGDEQAVAQLDEQVDSKAEAEELQAALAEANDRALRAQAELENFRKRVYRQMDEERKYAGLPLVRDLLPVIDNLERAIDAAEQDENSSSLLEGVKMVVQQFSSVLEQHHCKRINAKGETFDPHLHEALAQQPSEDCPAGCVVDVAQIGYQLHDRVVRPSQVFVSSGTPESTPEEDTNETAEEDEVEGMEGD